MLLLHPVLTMGCVWPVDINERDEVDIPPTFDRKFIVPTPEGTIKLTGTLTFSVEGAVSDPDDDVEFLNYDWFLDYPQGCEDADSSCRPAFTSGLGAKTVSVNPCNDYIKQFLVDGDLHLLELFVGDQPVELNPETGQRTVMGTYAYVSWWLETPVACP